MSNTEIRELEARLAELRKQEAEELENKKAEHKPVFRYTVKPAEKEFERVFDETCKLYKIVGECVNSDEAKAAGWSDHYIRSGTGIGSYLFNTGTNKVVMAVGGGTYFLGFYSDKSSETDMSELGELIAAHPDGTDVTELVKRSRERRAKTGPFTRSVD